MDFGVATVTRGAMETREGYIAVAEQAEKLGFGFISVNDHVVVPRDIASRYPYSDDGQWAARTAGACLDQLATLAFLAARTERLQTPHLRHGRAPAPAGADRQDAGHDRHTLRRPADRWLRRRLAEGGVRGPRRAALRRSRPRHG